MNNGKKNQQARINLVQQEDFHLNKLFREFRTTEDFGTECDSIRRITPEDQRAIDIIEKGTKHLTPGYEIPLPWKTNEPNLQNNRAYAIHRLNGLCQCFRREPDYQEEYHQAIQKYLDMGYASKVKDEDVGGHNEFYLPHHGVFKNSLTKKKLRVVFDSAAPLKGKCLNDTLITGPNLMNDLPTVLIRFREGAIAVTADIEAMFSRIRMKKEDARYHRFLWRPPGSEDIITYQMDHLR